MNALALHEPKSSSIYYGLRCPCGSHRTRRFAFHVYICETCDQSFTVAEALQAIGKAAEGEGKSWRPKARKPANTPPLDYAKFTDNELANMADGWVPPMDHPARNQ